MTNNKKRKKKRLRIFIYLESIFEILFCERDDSLSKFLALYSPIVELLYANVDLSLFFLGLISQIPHGKLLKNCEIK